MVASEWRRPVFEDANETAIGELLAHLPLKHIGQSAPCARRLHHQGGIIQNELSLNTDVKLTSMAPGDRRSFAVSYGS